MKTSHYTSTHVVGLALLTGLWIAACTPSNNNASGAGGAKGGSSSSSSSSKTGGTTGTSSSQTGGDTKSSSGGTTGTSSSQTGGDTSSSSGGTTGTSSSQTGGDTSTGTTTAVGGTGGGASSSASSSSGGSSSGGSTSQTGGNTSSGGTNSTGGLGAAACPAATSYPDCSLATGVVTGSACKPNPAIFALDANCNMGLWASDYTSSGYFYQPWCNSPTAGDCTLTMACAANSMHIAGSYLGNSTAVPVDGNGGWGANLQTTYPDAGPGCQMIDGTGLTGLTLDVNVTALPTGNHLDVGISLANGNSADYTAVLTAGSQTVQIPWTCFKNKSLCGSIPGPGITSFFFALDWFNDGVTHPVDITISNLGFY